MKIEWSHAGILRLVVSGVAIAMVCYHMWAIGIQAPEAIPYRGTHLLFALSLTFLIYRWNSSQDQPPSLLDYALLVLGAAPILYLFVNYEYIVTRIFYIDDLYASDMIMGVVLAAVIIEATRRIIGWALPLTAIAFLFYGLLVARVEPMRFLDQLYMKIGRAHV